MKVSIITPVFNGEAFIRDAAKSMLSQTYIDWEWIIVNDGSTDQTASILAELDDPRVIVVHQPNAGVSAARNRGLERASGELVTFLDADDMLPPRALQCRVEYLDANPHVDIVNGQVIVTVSGVPVRNYVPSTNVGPLFPRLVKLDESVFFNICYMIRRKSVLFHSFPVGMTHCEDLFFFLEIAHDTNLIYGSVDDIIYEYRQQPNSAMRNLSGLESGYITFLQRVALLSRLSPDNLYYLKSRISLIMFKSWVRKGKFINATKVLFRVRYLNTERGRVS